jgi:hypothetical protein
MNIVMTYSFWWNILWNWFNFFHKNQKEKWEKATEFYFVCHSLSLQSSPILTRTWLLFVFLGLTIHSYVCMSWPNKKNTFTNRGNAYGVIATTRCWVGPQNHNHFHNKASMQNNWQTKPNQWLLYLHVTGKVQLTSSLVASGDWGRGGAKKWVGLGRKKREREREREEQYVELLSV